MIKIKSIKKIKKESLASGEIYLIDGDVLIEENNQKREKHKKIKVLNQKIYQMIQFIKKIIKIN